MTSVQNIRHTVQIFELFASLKIPEFQQKREALHKKLQKSRKQKAKIEEQISEISTFLTRKEAKNTENLINLITNVGFPVAVAIYLLVRMESRLLELKDSITQLTVAINKWQQ